MKTGQFLMTGDQDSVQFQGWVLERMVVLLRETSMLEEKQKDKSWLSDSLNLTTLNPGRAQGPVLPVFSLVTEPI